MTEELKTLILDILEQHNEIFHQHKDVLMDLHERLKKIEESK